MTPFDAVAFVAMLMAFYAEVTPANFVKARAERPEYFAGGVIFGSKGDKLRLPDGREFDCIINAGMPVQFRSWAAQLIDPSAPGDADPFPLEDGPLVPLDETLVLPAPAPTEFTDLVAGQLAEFGASDDQLEHAGAAVVEFGDGTALGDAFDGVVEPAATHHQAFRTALDGDDIADEIAITEAQGGDVQTQKTALDEDAPPDLQEPDPGAPPDATGEPIPPGTPGEPPQ